MSLFDTIVMVDWSARSSPSPVRPVKDTIWAGVANAGVAADPVYFRTRAAVMDWLRGLFVSASEAGQRVLAGFDFPFGYPAGVAAKFCGEARALALWRWLSDRIEDAPDNANNRFAVADRMNRAYDGLGPFWGCPENQETPALPMQASRRHGADLPPERRLVEKRQRGAKTLWQLAYAGSVGSQVLVGLPRLEALRRDPAVADQIAVWPFESGLGLPDAGVVLAEVYPTIFEPAMTGQDVIKDAAQVRATAATLSAMDRCGTLEPLFAAAPNLTPAERVTVSEEEAWILGVGYERALCDAMAAV